MWNNNYWAARYWAPRYWAPVGRDLTGIAENWDYLTETVDTLDIESNISGLQVRTYLDTLDVKTD